MRPIEKTKIGFRQVHEFHTLIWNDAGKYVGQYQDDMLGSESVIFVAVDQSSPCCPDLTNQEMDAAS